MLFQKKQTKNDKSNLNPVKGMLNGIRLNDLINEKNLSIMPLTKDKTKGFKCLTLDKAFADNLASIREVSDSGSVSELKIQNKGRKPLFLLDGEQLLGALQNRTLNLSIMVPAKSSLVIPVSCVEEGRWGFRGSDRFVSSNHIYFSEGRRRRTRKINYSLAAGGERFSDQGEVWDDIDKKAEAMRTRSRTRSMDDMYENWEHQLEHFVDNLRPIKNQVGSIFLINGELKGLEIFDSASLFNHFYNKIIKSYAIDALEKMHARQRQIQLSNISSFLNDVKESDFNAYKAIGLGSDIRLSSTSLNLAGLEIENNMIHFLAFRERTNNY